MITLTVLISISPLSPTVKQGFRRHQRIEVRGQVINSTINRFQYTLENKQESPHKPGVSIQSRQILGAATLDLYTVFAVLCSHLFPLLTVIKLTTDFLSRQDLCSKLATHFAPPLSRAQVSQAAIRWHAYFNGSRGQSIR